MLEALKKIKAWHFLVLSIALNVYLAIPKANKYEAERAMIKGQVMMLDALIKTKEAKINSLQVINDSLAAQVNKTDTIIQIKYLRHEQKIQDIAQSNPDTAFNAVRSLLRAIQLPN